MKDQLLGSVASVQYLGGSDEVAGVRALDHCFKGRSRNGKGGDKYFIGEHGSLTNFHQNSYM